MRQLPVQRNVNRYIVEQKVNRLARFTRNNLISMMILCVVFLFFFLGFVQDPESQKYYIDD